MVSLKNLISICIVLGGMSIPALAQSDKWKTYEVKGDTLYNHEDFKGAIKYYNKAIDGQVNVATALRQPGSSFKAFTYATAFASKRWSPCGDSSRHRASSH